MHWPGCFSVQPHFVPVCSNQTHTPGTVFERGYRAAEHPHLLPPSSLCRMLRSQMNLSGSVEQRRGCSQSEGPVAARTGPFAEALCGACLPDTRGEPRLFLQLYALMLQPPTPWLGVQGLPSVTGTWAWCEDSPEKEQARDSSCRTWKVRLSYWLYWEHDSAAFKISVARDGIRVLFFYHPVGLQRFHLRKSMRYTCCALLREGGMHMRKTLLPTAGEERCQNCTISCRRLVVGKIPATF